MLAEWTTDLRHAARALRRTPGFTVTAVATLALAIGAVAGMFSVVDAVLLNPLPYAASDRLVDIAGTAPGSDMPEDFAVGEEFYLQYRDQSHQLEDISTYNSFTSTLRVGDRVERIRMSAPTNSLYSTLGARPILGRLPVAEDEDKVVVISNALWRSWFGGDSSVIGKSYSIAGESRTVIGIMGPEFRFPSDGTLLWIAGEIKPTEVEVGDFGTPLVGRMAPGATIETVANELTTLAKRLPERFGGPASYARLIGQHRAVVRPLLAEGMQWFQPMTAAAGIDDATVAAARGAALAGDMRRAAELVPERAIDFFTVCGSPRDVIPRLEGLVAAGANHLAFTVLPMMDIDETIRLIAREIMPHFGR